MDVSLLSRWLLKSSIYDKMKQTCNIYRKLLRERGRKSRLVKELCWNEILKEMKENTQKHYLKQKAFTIL